MASTYYDIEVETATFALTGEHKGAKMELVIEMSLQDYLDLKAMTSVAGFQEGATEDEVSEAMIQFTDKVRSWGNEIIESWNLRRKGKPLPANGDGFLKLPSELRNAILRTWMEHMGSLNPKLKAGSQNGKQSAGRKRLPAKSSRGRPNS